MHGLIRMWSEAVLVWYDRKERIIHVSALFNARESASHLKGTLSTFYFSNSWDYDECNDKGNPCDEVPIGLIYYLIGVLDIHETIPNIP